jgi:hypothetical protein
VATKERSDGRQREREDGDGVWAGGCGCGWCGLDRSSGRAACPMCDWRGEAERFAASRTIASTDGCVPHAFLAVSSAGSMCRSNQDNAVLPDSQIRSRTWRDLCSQGWTSKRLDIMFALPLVPDQHTIFLERALQHDTIGRRSQISRWAQGLAVRGWGARISGRAISRVGTRPTGGDAPIGQCGQRVWRARRRGGASEQAGRGRGRRRGWRGL